MINFVIGMLVRDVFMLEGDVVVSIYMILYIKVNIYLRMNEYIFLYFEFLNVGLYIFMYFIFMLYL